MERHSVEAVVRALNDAQVRYLIVGGLAVVAHGVVRFTADVDLVIDLEESNARRAVQALTPLGYRPRAPVDFDRFAEPAARQEWVRDKGLTVFSLRSDRHPSTEIDLFVESPFDFGAAYAAALRGEVAPGLEAPFVGLADLVEMKRQAGRPQDLRDIDDLERLREDRSRT